MLGATRRLLTALAVSAALSPAAPISAQEGQPPVNSTVQQLFEGRESWVGRYVQISGKVARWDRSNSFILEDNFGGGIEVIVIGPLPKREAEVVVKGIIAIDAVRNPYLNATYVGPVGGPPPAPPVDSDNDGVPDTRDRCPGTLGAEVVDATGCEVKKSFVDVLKTNQTIILIDAGVGILGLGLFFALRRPQTQLPSPTSAPMPTMAGGAASAASSGVDEGKTIRIARPDESQGTLQILPGRLEICSGPDAGNVADIRFVRDRTAGNPIPEVTFGRHGQASPTHVVLKSQTVSRLHAKFRFEAGRWSVINYSETNPVTVNKRPMTTTEPPVVLSDKDVIEMGEVGFRYHA